MARESPREGEMPTARSGTVVARPAGNSASLYARIIAAQNEIVLLAHDPNKVVDAVIRRAQELTRSTGAVVEILDGEDFVYWAASGTAHAQIGLRMHAAGSLSGLCVARNRVLRCDDSEDDPRVNRDACRRVGLRSMLVTPLLYEGRPFAVLKVLSPYPGAYRESDIQVMGMMATLVGAVLGHAIEYSDLLSDYRGRVEADRMLERHREDLVGGIESLIRNRQLDIVFQPMVSLNDGKMFALEALSRFPEGTPSPDVWFAQAAEVGLGLMLELEAARLALGRLADVPQPYRLSINVSPETIVTGAFEALLSAHDMARVIVEITEHTTVPDYDRLRACLRGLQSRGVLVAIDDTGAGFASLRHILQLSPDIIKLDISLTRGIDIDTRRQTMVAAIQTFASGTNATIVVEGVENENERATLIGLGIEYGQGFHLGRPGPLDVVLGGQGVVG